MPKVPHVLVYPSKISVAPLVLAQHGVSSSCSSHHGRREKHKRGSSFMWTIWKFAWIYYFICYRKSLRHVTPKWVVLKGNIRECTYNKCEMIALFLFVFFKQVLCVFFNKMVENRGVHFHDFGLGKVPIVKKGYLILVMSPAWDSVLEMPGLPVTRTLSTCIYFVFTARLYKGLSDLWGMGIYGD